MSILIRHYRGYERNYRAEVDRGLSAVAKLEMA